MVRAAAALGLTGAGGLLLELVWARAVGLSLGLTTASQALAVAAFVGGTGAGAALAARLPGAGARPWRWAARLLLAGSALALPVAPLTLGAARAGGGGGATLLMLVAAAVLLGGGSPLILAGAAGPGRPGRAGLLLGANLAGAMAGAGAAAWLVPALGLRLTGIVGAGACLAAGLLVWREPARPAPAPAPAGGELPLGAAAFAAGLAGAAALGLEVLLFRLLVMRTGGFTLSLAGVAASFLLALGAGSLLLPAALSRLPGGTGAGLCLVLAAAGAGFAPLSFAVLEGLLPWHQGGSALGQAGRPFLFGLLVGGPAGLGLGAVTPLLYAAAAGPRERVAGVLLLAQAAGGAAGAALCPLVLLPWLPGPSPFPWAGLLLGATALVGLAPLRPRRPALAGLGALLLLAALLPAMRESAVPPFLRSGAARPGREVVATAHDSVTVATAVYDRRTHEKLLFTDGFQAATVGEEGAYMRLLGHLPLLLHRQPRRVVLLCVGTGTTLHSAALHRAVERIDAVEISPAVAGLTGWFAGPGSSPPDPAARFPFRQDPRVVLHLADGRRFLGELAAARGRRPGADVITQEPLLPYTPAAFPFYTAEYYALVRAALAPGGLFVQWIPLGSTPPAMTRRLVETLAGSFPAVTLWLFSSSALLVAGEAPAVPDPARVAAAGRAVGEDLVRSGCPRAEDLLAGWGFELAGAAAAGGALLHDDRPALEAFVRPGGWEILGWLPEALAWFRSRRPAAPPAFLPAATYAAQDLYLAGRIEEALAERAALGGGAAGETASALYQAALAKDPLHRNSWLALRRRRSLLGVRAAAAALAAGRPAEARARLAPALILDPGEAWGHVLLAAAEAALGRPREAGEALREAWWWWPGVFRWEEYLARRGDLLAPLARDPAPRALLADLEAGRGGERLGPFRPRELVFAPPGEEGRLEALARAFPGQFAGSLAEGLRAGGAVRLRALGVAAALGDPWLAAEAAAGLADYTEEERAGAAALLATTPFRAEAALAALGGDAAAPVRQALARALGRSAWGQEPLLALLEDPEPAVRRAAAAAGRIRFGELEGYDPEAPAAARAAAVARLRGRAGGR